MSSHTLTYALTHHDLAASPGHDSCTCNMTLPYAYTQAPARTAPLIAHEEEGGADDTLEGVVNNESVSKEGGSATDKGSSKVSEVMTIIHTNVYTYMYTYVYICIYRYKCIHEKDNYKVPEVMTILYIQMYTYMHTHIYMYIYLYVDNNMYIYIYIYIFKVIYIYI